MACQCLMLWIWWNRAEMLWMTCGGRQILSLIQKHAWFGSWIILVGLSHTHSTKTGNGKKIFADVECYLATGVDESQSSENSNQL